MAGVQIALTQPIRLDEVIVEGEDGSIAEDKLGFSFCREVLRDQRCLSD